MTMRWAVFLLGGIVAAGGVGLGVSALAPALGGDRGDRPLPASPAVASPAEGTSPDPSDPSVCFDEDADVEAEGGKRGPLVGDVDGDGSVDRVFVTARVTGEERCRYFLRVETAAGPREILIRELGFGDFDLYLKPHLLAEIDRDEGLEIVVQVHRGAAAEFARVFTMRPAGLRMLKIRGQSRHTFPYAGSLSGFGGVDCVRPSSGEVVLLEARRKEVMGDVYLVTRTFYRLIGTTFVVQRQEHHELALEDITFERFPELVKNLPFEGCARVKPR